MKLDNKVYFEIIRKHRRREKIRKFLHSSRLVWLLDPRPYEAPVLTRSVADEYSRDSLRMKYSWSSIARLQNEKTLKAGLVGIVTAPILASLAVANVPNFHYNFPVQMAFIFASGLLFVIATAVYNVRAPCFIKKYLEPADNKRFKPETIREIASSIQYEFLKLGCTIEITKHNVQELVSHERAYQTANILLSREEACFKVGFDAQGQALIEKLLFKLASRHGFKIFEEYKRDDKNMGLRLRSGPGWCIPAGKVYVRHLMLEKAQEHHVASTEAERDVGELGERDLVLKFYDPYIKTLHQLDKDKQVEPYALGLHNILHEEYADTIVEELAYWQSWQRPFSRLSAVWLYQIALLSFVIFLIYQSNVVWMAVAKPT